MSNNWPGRAILVSGELRFNLIDDHGEVGVECAVNTLAHRTASVPVFVRARGAYPAPHLQGIGIHSAGVDVPDDPDHLGQVSKDSALAIFREAAPMIARVAGAVRADFFAKAVFNSLGNGHGDTSLSHVRRKMDSLIAFSRPEFVDQFGQTPEQITGAEDSHDVIADHDRQRAEMVAA